MALKDLVRDLAKYFPSQVIPAVVAFASIPILTNVFPPDDYGDYRLVLAAVALLSPLGGWLSTSIIRFFPEYDLEEKLGGFYGTVAKLFGISVASFSVLWGFGLVLAGDRLRGNLRQLFYIGLLLLIINAAFGIIGSLIRSRREVGWFSFGASARSLLNIGVGILLVVGLETNISGFLWGMVIGGLIIVPVMWWRAQRGISVTWRGPIDRALGRAMLSYSYPLVLGLSATWLLRLSDRYILEAFHGSTEVGIYAASYGLADTSIGVIVTLFQLPFVVLANRIYEEKGDTEAANFVSDSARLFLLTAVPAAVGMSVLASPLVRLLTGPEYLEGYRIIPFVTTATLLSGLGFWYRTAFMFRKRTGQQLIAISGGAIVNVGLNFLLIPRYGYYAAGITTLLGFFTVNVLSYYLGRKLFNWHLPLTSIGKALAASVPMALVVGILQRWSLLPTVMTLLLSIFLGIVTYVGGLLAMREFTKADVAKLRQFLRGSPIDRTEDLPGD